LVIFNGVLSTKTPHSVYNPPFVLFGSPRPTIRKGTTMRSLLVPSAVLLMAAAGVAVAAEELKSGLQVGERTSPYNIRDITGPNAGKTLCYR
jgi:hypothetical protein